jgi:hypothetical protein
MGILQAVEPKPGKVGDGPAYRSAPFAAWDEDALAVRFGALGVATHYFYLTRLAAASVR